MLGIFLDLETSGLDPKKHRVLEAALKIIDLSNGNIKFDFQKIIKQPDSVWKASDPNSLAVNGFTWELVSTGDPEQKVTKDIIEAFQSLQIRRGNAVFICQNPSFDRQFFSQLVDVYQQEELLWPYHWLDLASMNWAVTLSFDASQDISKLPLSKDRIAQSRNLPKECKPHRAMNGVEHLLLCYRDIVGIPPKPQKISSSESSA